MSGDPLDDPRVMTHLAAVATALQRQGEPAATTAILENLRGHIRDAVAARAGAPDAIAAVLAELDPPDSYAGEAPTAPARRLGWWAFLIALAGPVVGLLAGLGGGQTAWLAFCTVEASAVAAGIAARRQPWGRTAIATAVGLFLLPLILAALFPSH
jgi:hypothetical protein